MGEMKKTSAKMCKSCRFSLVTNGSTYVCDYLCMTKQRRNCPIGWCDKYEPKKRKRRMVMKSHGQGVQAVE